MQAGFGETFPDSFLCEKHLHVSRLGEWCCGLLRASQVMVKVISLGIYKDPMNFIHELSLQQPCL